MQIHTSTAYQPPSGFRLVYQGGHHNVYCDGAEHIWTTGGYTRMQGIAYSRQGKCDCHKYQKLAG